MDKAQEKRWNESVKIVEKSTDKKKKNFKDKDWGTVMKIWKNKEKVYGKKKKASVSFTVSKHLPEIQEAWSIAERILRGDPEVSDEDISKIKEIREDHGRLGHLGKAQSQEPGVIYLSLDSLEDQAGSSDGELFAQILETILHEAAHVIDDMEHGEEPAERMEVKVKPQIDAEKQRKQSMENKMKFKIAKVKVAADVNEVVEILSRTTEAFRSLSSAFSERKDAQTLKEKSDSLLLEFERLLTMSQEDPINAIKSIQISRKEVELGKFIDLLKIYIDRLSSYVSSGQLIERKNELKMQIEQLKEQVAKGFIPSIDAEDMIKKLEGELSYVESGNYLEGTPLEEFYLIFKGLVSASRDLNKFLSDYSQVNTGPERSDVEEDKERFKSPQEKRVEEELKKRKNINKYKNVFKKKVPLTRFYQIYSNVGKFENELEEVKDRLDSAYLAIENAPEGANMEPLAREYNEARSALEKVQKQYDTSKASLSATYTDKMTKKKRVELEKDVDYLSEALAMEMGSGFGDPKRVEELKRELLVKEKLLGVITELSDAGLLDGKGGSEYDPLAESLGGDTIKSQGPPKIKRRKSTKPGKEKGEKDSEPKPFNEEAYRGRNPLMRIFNGVKNSLLNTSKAKRSLEAKKKRLEKALSPTVTGKEIVYEKIKNPLGKPGEEVEELRPVVKQDDTLLSNLSGRDRYEYKYVEMLRDEKLSSQDIRRLREDVAKEEKALAFVEDSEYREALNAMVDYMRAKTAGDDVSDMDIIGNLRYRGRFGEEGEAILKKELDGLVELNEKLLGKDWVPKDKNDTSVNLLKELSEEYEKTYLDLFRLQGQLRELRKIDGDNSSKASEIKDAINKVKERYRQLSEQLAVPLARRRARVTETLVTLAKNLSDSGAKTTTERGDTLKTRFRSVEEPDLVEETDEGGLPGDYLSDVVEQPKVRFDTYEKERGGRKSVIRTKDQARRIKERKEQSSPSKPRFRDIGYNPSEEEAARKRENRRQFDRSEKKRKEKDEQRSEKNQEQGRLRIKKREDRLSTSQRKKMKKKMRENRRMLASQKKYYESLQGAGFNFDAQDNLVYLARKEAELLRKLKDARGAERNPIEVELDAVQDEIKNSYTKSPYNRAIQSQILLEDAINNYQNMEEGKEKLAEEVKVKELFRNHEREVERLRDDERQMWERAIGKPFYDTLGGKARKLFGKI